MGQRQQGRQGKPGGWSEFAPDARQVPQNIDAERSVLGAILLDNKHLWRVVEILKPGDFFLEPHRIVFEMCIAMSQAEPPITIETVSIMEELTRTGDLERVGGVPFLSHLTDGVPRVLNIEHHATIIKELSLKRALSHLGEATRQSGLNPGVSLSDGVAHVEEGIKEIREWDTFKDTKPMLLSAIVDENFGTLEKMASGEALMVGIPTGYPDLDEVTAGWVAGDMVVLAARPSVGKTALSLEFAHRQVSRGIPVFYVSLEMNRLQLLLRLICLRARVDSHALRHGRLDDTDRSKMFKAMTELREMPLWITDPTRLSSRDLVYRVRGMGEQHRVRLCVVDYLQLMVAATDKENRTQEVSQISRDCKEAAKILGKISDGTLIVLSQLTRLGNHERPQLHHLRESGEIEQNADVVMFIYNEKENAQLGQADPIPKKLDVQKQRNGITKTIDVVYLGQFNAFEPGESERPLFKD